MRFLFVVAPLHGHAAPLRAVAARLRSDGHEVAWAGAGAWLRAFPGATGAAGATVYDCAPERFASPAMRPADLTGPAAFQFLLDGYLLPLANEMLPGTAAAIADFGPDVVVADQHTYAGATAAHAAGVPWATSASTTAELVEPYTPVIAEWIASRLATIAPGPDPRWSPWLVLAYSTPELVGPLTRPRNVCWVGPALPPTKAEPRRSKPALAKEALAQPKPLVVVTLGTANGPAGARFLRVCAEALAARADLDTLVVDPDGVLGPEPGVPTARWIPQLAVLEQASLVICHGGHNTVCESLWHGVPLIVAPIRDDQPVIANQVVAAGAGVRLRFARAGAAQVTAAVETVLGEPSYASAAARIAGTFRAAGGADAASAALVKLAVRADRELV